MKIASVWHRSCLRSRHRSSRSEWTFPARGRGARRGKAIGQGRSQLPARVLWRAFLRAGRGKTVALTFDDGPGRSTAAILKVLARYRVPASFFNIGVNVAARPWPVRKEVKAGYAMGDHTGDHPNMNLLSAASQAREIDRMNAELKALAHVKACAYRPPYGNYDATALSLAQHRRMSVWLWSVDTQDWMARGSGSSFWVNRIIRLAEQEGRALRHPVVLMHNQPTGNPATVSALPVIIRFFRAHGYRFVRV
jgi:peptidoglycan/xylan/chitin deacetylase (PgdA/CDA1 family)